MADLDSVDRCVAEAVARYPEINPEVEGVVDRVERISKQINRIFEETLVGHGLSRGDYKLLMNLAVAPPPGRLSAGDLGRQMLMSSGGMTSRLDRLVAAGLIRRLPDPNDRRGVLVELTEDGSRRIDKAVGEQAGKEIDALSALTGRELDSLNRLLRKVLTFIEREPSA
jgi:DNA-binding MarR family transcriptional regulator